MAEVFVHQIDDDEANRAGLLPGLNQVEVIRKIEIEGAQWDLLVPKTAWVQVIYLLETGCMLQACDLMKIPYRLTQALRC